MTIEHDAARRRFTTKLPSGEAYLSYERPRSGVLDLQHTIVPEAEDGIEALGAHGVREVLTTVARFDDFTDDNDPWGEHDCAVLTVDGRRIIFKHNYYDRDLQFHSPDASDPPVTERVLTIMLSEEY